MRAEESTKSRKKSDGAPERRRTTGDAALGILVAVIAAGLLWLVIAAVIALAR